MTLSKSSALHYWSSRYGVLPLVGGRPAFSRNTAGAMADARGEYFSALINTPRSGWEKDQATSANEQRAMLLLEQGGSNLLSYPETLGNAAWVKDAGCTVSDATADVVDPFGGNSASRVVIGTSGNGWKQTVSTTVASNSYVSSVWLRCPPGQSASVLADIIDGGTIRQTTFAVTDQWQRFSFITAFSGSAGTTIQVYFFINALMTVYAFCADLKLSKALSSAVRGSGAGPQSRAADALYWNFPVAVQGMIGHLRLVETGSGVLGATVASIINAAGSGTPNLILYGGGAGSGYILSHTETGTVTSQPSGAANIGDTVDLLPILFSDGSVQLIQSINGAAVTAGGRSAALAFAGSSWSDTKLWLNSQGTIGQGLLKAADLKLVKYADVVASTAQGIADELRAFELSPAGDQL
jgi:hypothetical protein